MDQATVQAYDYGAAGYANDWLEQPPPDDMYALLSDFFAQGPTADIGCGAGRDVAWLNANGYSAIGYDASAGLLAQARARYPELRFERAALPELAGIADASFANVLCETVLMHLDPAVIGAAVSRLMAILQPGGTLFVSWRISDVSQRDKNDRLYSAFDGDVVREALREYAILFDRSDVNASSGKTVQRMIVRR